MLELFLRPAARNTSVVAGVVLAAALAGCAPDVSDKEDKGGISLAPDFHTSVCYEYAAPVLPPDTSFCNDSRHGFGVYKNDADDTLVQKLIPDKDSKTGEDCYQTYPDAPEQWRICDREGNPYYYERAPIVPGLTVPTAAPTPDISIGVRVDSGEIEGI